MTSHAFFVHPDTPLGVEVIDGAFGDCSGLRDYLDTLDWTVSPVGEYGKTSPIRTSSSTFRPFVSYTNPPVIEEFARAVWQQLSTYSLTYGVTFDMVEPISFNRYSPGEEFLKHADYFRGSDRIISAVAYLNTVSEGGETVFTHPDFSVSPVEGRLVIFPSNYLFTHFATAPATEIKYSAAFWARG